MLPQCSHICLKRGMYYYRRRLPSPYRGEVTLSLRTRHYREARIKTSELNRLFSSCVSEMSEKPNLDQILRDYLREWLEADEEARIDTPTGRTVYAVSAAKGREALEQDEAIISMLHVDAGEALANRDTSSVAHEVDQLIQDHALPEDVRTRLGLGLLQARVQAYEAALKRVTQPYRYIELSSPPQSIQVAEGSKATIGPLFSTFSTLFVDMMLKNAEWTGHTAGQNKKTYAMFIEICGDKALDAYDRRDFARFYDMLTSLPKYYGKAKHWRRMKLMEIIESNRDVGEGLLSMTTVKRHFAALTSLFNKAIERGAIVSNNQAAGFKFPNQAEERKAWKEAQLHQLFQSPVWTGCKSARHRSERGEEIVYDSKYWLPILGLYHGNRLEEFAQLRREDVNQTKNIWVFEVTSEDGRKLKNRQSTRFIPVHPKLIELGFLNYVEEACAHQSDFVFPDLAHDDPSKKLGTSFSKWFTRYRKAIGMYEPLLDYHSFRHTFTTAAYSVNASDAIVDALTGHNGKGTSREVYLKQLNVPSLFKIVRKIEWPGLLDHLTPYQKRSR